LPRLAERYYVHVPERYVTAGFERFSEYVARKQVEAFPTLTSSPQYELKGPWQCRGKLQ
jgi:hypothetical protein